MRQRLTVFGVVALGGSVAFVLTIQGFLAVSRPVDGDILVVEGWIWHSSAVKQALAEFNRGRHKWLVTVGDPDGTKQGPAAAKTSAELAAERLRQLGVDEHRMIVLPVPDVPWHRTYASALTFRNWLIARRWWTSARGMYSTLSKTLGFPVRGGVAAAESSAGRLP